MEINLTPAQRDRILQYLHSVTYDDIARRCPEGDDPYTVQADLVALRNQLEKQQ
ncbi:MAG TPA: hypothetical protein V6D20_05355 [Candidatus Obscuribacterales bacterium]